MTRTTLHATTLRRITAALVATAVVGAGLGMLTSPAQADGPEKEKEFRVSGADVDFSVEKDDGRYDVSVDIDDAKPGSRWRVVLKHEGDKIHSRIHRADDDGDVDIDRTRPDMRGTDVFKVRVKRIGGDAQAQVIRMP